MTAANLDSEMGLIGEMMVQYPYVTIDVEFAGVVHHPPYTGSRPTPDEIYAALKSNVDEVPAVQIGITLSDAEGNLPTRSSSSPEQEIAWEVVFSDFDAGRDPHVVDSVEFLKNQGIDFDLARQIGVTSTAFGEKLLAILPPPSRRGELTWSAFGGAYDMGYLLKMLTGGQPLPETRQQFMQLVKSRLGGGRIFDSKYLVEHDRQDLRNAGLRHTADVLGVRQQEGVKMLAGHKSVVAAAIFATIRSQGVHLLHGVIDGIL
nr:Putative CCR4-associated factor 1 [Oryza sativa Japonica Group]AAN04513.1 Putative CCR4-associated factor 1 [Oryza sativa Japonica Group]ABB46658.2 CAF1 family ribonuclease containing protein [Oryza sativa Japonica Group]